MKVIPSNQTLLLASERGNPGTTSGATLARALNAASSGGVLRRLTIVAAEPDTSVVYVHADYASEDSDGQTNHAAGPSAAAPSLSSESVVTLPTVATDLDRVSRSGALALSNGRGARDPRDDYGNRKTASRDALSSYLKPTEQYARTQGMRSDATSTQARIDVRV